MESVIANLLSREQAAYELGISLGALCRQVKLGKLAVLKISPKCARITRQELERFKQELQCAR